MEESNTISDDAASIVSSISRACDLRTDALTSSNITVSSTSATAALATATIADSDGTSGDAAIDGAAEHRLGVDDKAVNLFLDLSAVFPFSGGTVSLACHPVEPRLFVSVQELGNVLAVSTADSSKVLSTLEVQPTFEDGPKSVAFDDSKNELVVVVDECLTRWREDQHSGWIQQGEALEMEDDFDSISVDACGRILLDLSPPCWLLPDGSLEKVPLAALPEEPPKAVDGDLDAVYRRQTWEATTVDLSNALMVCCRNGGIFFYSRDSKSAHYLPPGEKSAKELSLRKARLSRGIVVHMESELPEDGCCCTSPAGGMYVVGCVEDGSNEGNSDVDAGGLILWSFACGEVPTASKLRGFRKSPQQLDSIVADANGTLYLCVVEEWPDERAIYCVTPEQRSGETER
eukprot:TRINITY_DN17964_c0_g1_i1.p1 TRINITY_DN17964_c0_g1~~TRINITY_DN17964_c0_g1_i1.p1  ORF type:complete len:404 (-),score=86.34 TRINITY_DN17964_c0_g1_i1:35-1246(-)